MILEDRSSILHSDNIRQAEKTQQAQRLGDGLDDPAFEFQQREGIFRFSRKSRSTLGSTQPIKWAAGFCTGGNAAGVG